MRLLPSKMTYLRCSYIYIYIYGPLARRIGARGVASAPMGARGPHNISMFQSLRYGLIWTFPKICRRRVSWAWLNWVKEVSSAQWIFKLKLFLHFVDQAQRVPRRLSGIGHQSPSATRLRLAVTSKPVHESSGRSGVFAEFQKLILCSCPMKATALVEYLQIVKI